MTYPNGHEGGRMYKLNTIRAAVCGLIQAFEDLEAIREALNAE